MLHYCYVQLDQGCGGKSAHYGSEQSSYYSITAWLTKAVGQD